MEEKKIIGQECEFYDEGHCLCYSDESHYPHCLEYPNCYYKQLQLKDKMIELMAKRMEVAFMGDIKEFIRLFERKALAELEE